MKIFVPFDFGRTLETGMGTVMSFVLNSSAMFLLGSASDTIYDSSRMGWRFRYCSGH